MLKSTNKNFGLLLAALCFFIGCKFNFYFFILVPAFLYLAFFNSDKLNYLNKKWVQLGLLLQKFTSPIILSIVYIAIIVPIKLYLKIFKKNFFNINIDLESKSYWLRPDATLKDSQLMRQQF